MTDLVTKSKDVMPSGGSYMLLHLKLCVNSNAIKYIFLRMQNIGICAEKCIYLSYFCLVY